MKSEKIKEIFIKYFLENGHQYKEPCSLVPPNNDTSILFTNSGMNQFKPIFLGSKEPTVKYVCNNQKCARLGGKHNDLNDVGRDTYHHTYFNMLGNWAFNMEPDSQYKKNAITLAWKLLTEQFKMNPDRLYVTYFGGEAGIGADLETKTIWEEFLDTKKILPFGMKDNFWEMAELGPTGPCTEIHYDLIGNRDCTNLINKNDPTVVEIWNLVFISYQREEKGLLTPLKFCSVDTGMGFERLVMALQGKISTYDTDIFQPLFDVIYQETKIPHDKSENTLIAYRIIADHLRAIIHMLSDDIMPSDKGRGWALVGLIKRSCYYMHTFLNTSRGKLTRIARLMGEYFAENDPEIKKHINSIIYVINSEENKYGNIIWSGVMLFRKLLEKTDHIITKEDYIMLTKTRGIYPDLVEQFAMDHGFIIEKI